MSTEKLLEKSQNHHITNRYINFINSIKMKNNIIGHRHHILPKAKDMFPEYKNFNENSWNCVILSLREHFIAHWMLAKMFPKSSQSLAFYHMCNQTNNKKSKEYEKSRLVHIEKMKNLVHTPERNAKISAKLKGVPKTIEHIEKLKGPRPKWVCDKIKKSMSKIDNSWKNDSKRVTKHSENMKLRHKNNPRIYSTEERYNMKLSKMNFKLKTPLGIFNTYEEAANCYNVDRKDVFNIFRSLNKIPKHKKLKLFCLDKIDNYSWSDYGFIKIIY